MSTLSKKRRKFIGNRFYLFLFAIAFAVYIFGGEGENHEMVEKIRKGFRDRGRIVKVSDIHPGDWDRVCTTSFGGPEAGDILDLVEMFSGVKKESLELIGGHETYFVDDFDSILYFFTPPNKVEAYSISDNDLLFNVIKSDMGCFSKETAYFSFEHYSEKDWETLVRETDFMKDRLILSIISKPEGEKE